MKIERKQPLESQLHHLSGGDIFEMDYEEWMLADPEETAKVLALSTDISFLCIRVSDGLIKTVHRSTKVFPIRNAKMVIE